MQTKRSRSACMMNLDVETNKTTHWYASISKTNHQQKNIFYNTDLELTNNINDLSTFEDFAFSPTCNCDLESMNHFLLYLLNFSILDKWFFSMQTKP